MTTDDSNDNFEVMKVGKSALHIIQENHGDEGLYGIGEVVNPREVTKKGTFHQ